jgi:hypothetical protein
MELTTKPQFNYKISDTALKFHASDARVRGVVGPFGSGKTTMVMMELLYLAMDQPPAPNGVRYSRWGVVRKTYGNLKNITREMLMMVLPHGAGYITQGNAPLSGTFRFNLPDKTTVEMELILWALDDAKSLDNIKSANWTGILLNEATELSKDVLEIVFSRINRYPPADLGGVKWGGVLMDFNPAPPGHWINEVFNNTTIAMDGYTSEIALFKQPPAAFKIEKEDGTVEYKLNPDAENLENLKGGLQFYADQIGVRLQTGRQNAQDEIDLLFCMLPIKIKRGRLVWPKFNRERHVAKRPLTAFKGQPLVAGFDTSGLHPAVVIGQMQYGRWCIIGELKPEEDMGLELFITGVLVPFFPAHYPGCHVVIACDPANTRDSWTMQSPTTHLQNEGFEVAMPLVNNIQTRIDCVANMMNKDYGGLMISPSCTELIKCIEEGYHYPRHRLIGTSDYIYSDKPAKNDASHLADALQYFALHVTRASRTDQEGLRDFTASVARRNALKRNMLGGSAYV